MHLSRLEIIGFKSFASRVNLEFGQGISAIVGPNGCGKTNIIDAIRWVLGEQATKGLRVNTMRDVIFKGTKTRRQLGMAEISITLVGDELPPQYGSNAKITRRITSYGETYYLINDIPVRLKDVHNLLYDTGIGVGSYYHIDQDSIKRILDSNTFERRALFEEAAGVSKFKRDLHESSLKL
ncbi:MAG: AAA family ATPase, partial [bacterium]